MPLQKLRRVYIRKADTSLLCTGVCRATLYFVRLQSRQKRLINTSLEQQTETELHVPAGTASHLQRKAKLNLTTKKLRRKRTVVR